MAYPLPPKVPQFTANGGNGGGYGEIPTFTIGHGVPPGSVPRVNITARPPSAFAGIKQYLQSGIGGVALTVNNKALTRS